MISRTFFSYGSASVPTYASGSSRSRTSCWVMVEPPRGLPSSVSMAAETNPTGSKPGFSQNVLSSMDVVASMSSGGMSAYLTSSRRSVPKTARSTLPDRSQALVCRENTIASKASRGSGRSVA